MNFVKYIVFVSTVLGYFNIECSIHESAHTQKINFLSYNIQLSGLDVNGHVWCDRKYAVSTLLSYADIIALQEITHDQLIDLKQMLPDYQFVGFNTVTGKSLEVVASDTQEGLVIAFKRAMYSLKSTEMIWYSDTPAVPSQRWGSWESAFPKALQKATLIFCASNHELDIFNSHFAHDDDLSGVINPRLLSSAVELELLKTRTKRYWISAGDRNFHEPRDTSAYEFYSKSPDVADSRTSSLENHGLETTFIGYEGHPRLNEILSDGTFAKKYYLDIVFHNPNLMMSNYWVSHPGEYDDSLNLLPLGNCKQPNKRLFASDHTAIFVEYSLYNFSSKAQGLSDNSYSFLKKTQLPMRVYIQMQHNFTFTPITEKNLPSLQPLLYQWLHSPHVAQWWPAPTDNEDFLNSFLKRIRSGTKPYLVSCNDVPMGYIQTYAVDRPGTAPYDKMLPENLVGIDQFIGELDYLHKGFGALFIKQFIQDLLVQDPTQTIILDPTATNLAAIRCYEKVGFQRMGEYDPPYGPDGPALLMVYKAE